jgi:hypothetical protein
MTARIDGRTVLTHADIVETIRENIAGGCVSAAAAEHVAERAARALEAEGAHRDGWERDR